MRDTDRVFGRADFLYCGALSHWGQMMLDVLRVPALLVEEDAADRARFRETLGGGALDVLSAATRRDGTAAVSEREFGLYVFGLGTGCAPEDLEMARAVRARHPEPPIILLLRGEPSIEAQERALTLDAFWMPYAVSGDAMRLHIERTFQRRNQRARSIAGAIRSTGGLTCCEEEHLFHVLCGRSSKTVAVTACISPRTVSVHRTRAFAKAGRENIGDWIAASSRNVWDHADAVEAESVERISRVRIRPVDVREESETSTAHRECDAVVPVFPRRP